MNEPEIKEVPKMKEAKPVVDTDIDQHGMSFFHDEDPCTLCGVKWEDDPTGDCQIRLLEFYISAKLEMAYYEGVLANTKKRIVAATKIRMAKDGEVGKVAEVDGGSINIITPKKARVTWNSAGLDGYAIANPDILAFRTEKWPEPSIRIKVD